MSYKKIKLNYFFISVICFYFVIRNKYDCRVVFRVLPRVLLLFKHIVFFFCENLILLSGITMSGSVHKELNIIKIRTIVQMHKYKILLKIYINKHQ